MEFFGQRRLPVQDHFVALDQIARYQVPNAQLVYAYYAPLDQLVVDHFLPVLYPRVVFVRQHFVSASAKFSHVTYSYTTSSRAEYSRDADLIYRDRFVCRNDVRANAVVGPLADQVVYDPTSLLDQVRQYRVVGRAVRSLVTSPHPRAASQSPGSSSGSSNTSRDRVEHFDYERHVNSFVEENLAENAEMPITVLVLLFANNAQLVAPWVGARS
ncbi:unnamed protein product [Sphagnum jensenii]